MENSHSSARFPIFRKILPLAGLVLLAILTSCSSTSINESDPGSLLKDAEDDIQSEHYQIAIDKLRIIKNKFPYSKYALDAQLRIADVYFMQDSFTEAASSYESFRDLHPKHEKVPYAMFKAGKSYFNDAPGNVARDMTPARKALDAYIEFLKRFPSAADADEARKDSAKLRSLLAEKELYVADFYFKRDFYDSAKPRYKKIIELYSETEAAKTAETKLVKIEEKLSSEESLKNGRDSGQHKQ